MNGKRLEFFQQLSFDEKLALEAKDFMVSEIEEIIAETPMTDTNKRISVDRYIKCMTLEEIAAKENLDIKTVRKRVSEISLMLKLTCSRLFI